MRASDIAECNFQIHGIIGYSDKWSQITITPHLVKSGGKHRSQGRKSKSVWERPNEIIDINMDTERKTCGAKVRNSSEQCNPGPYYVHNGGFEVMWQALCNL